MGRLNAASLAHEQSVLSTGPAAAREHSNIHDSLTNRCVTLVCWSNPAGLPTAPTALAGASGVGQNFRKELTFLERVSLDGSPSLKTNVPRLRPVNECNRDLSSTERLTASWRPG
jgi:hypothetical protein